MARCDGWADAVVTIRVIDDCDSTPPTNDQRSARGQLTDDPRSAHGQLTDGQLTDGQLSTAAASNGLTLRSRVVRIVVAWPMIALGIALLLEANLGVAPFDVLNTGLSESLDVPFSLAYPLVALTFFIVGGILGGRVGWASVLGTFVIGPLIGVFRQFLPEVDLLVGRAAMLVGATLLLAVAVCMVITTELGAGPSEVVMLGLVSRRVPIVYARWISDGLPLPVGAVLGGEVGIGTVIFGFALGPLIKGGLMLARYTPRIQPGDG